MIYALKYGSVSGKVRQEIRLAIARQGDLAPFVAQGLIAHIVGSHPGGDYHCLYCGDQLKPYALARPGKRVPAENWYFQHMGNGKCIGPSSTPTSDFKNPAGHGCFVNLGCETDDAGNTTPQARTCCHTIVNGQTYCHLARRNGCIPGLVVETIEIGETEDAVELVETIETVEIVEVVESVEPTKVAKATEATGAPVPAEITKAAKAPRARKATKSAKAEDAVGEAAALDNAVVSAPAPAEITKAAKAPRARKATKSAKAEDAVGEAAALDDAVVSAPAPAADAAGEPSAA